MRKNMNSNRSTRRTRAAIRNALLKAMETKPIAEITVQEIIDEANVCRTTFYAHYRDIQELVHSIGDDVIDEVGEQLSAMRYHEDQGTNFPTITSVVQTYADNAYTIRLLNSPNGDPTFNTRMQNRIYEVIAALRRDYDPDHFNEEHHRLYSHYVISGGISVMNELLTSRKDWDPVAAGKVFGEMAAYGQRVFQINNSV